MKRLLHALVVVLGVGAVIGAIAAYSIVRSGLSTRAAPGRLEEIIAMSMRRLATPAAVRTQSNPVAPTPEVVEGALAHWADHCAACHANDGSGSTPIGRSFYPPAPDMRAERTQALTDGELFSIIEHGIRLTGMPAWGTGTAEGARESWALVHFIRRLPQLTPEDIARMVALNPMSPAAFREAEAMRRFLESDVDSPPAAPPAKHSKH